MIEKEPEVEKHYYKRGQIYEKLKKYEKAIRVKTDQYKLLKVFIFVQDLNKVLSLNSQSTNGFNLRARTYMVRNFTLKSINFNMLLV